MNLKFCQNGFGCPHYQIEDLCRWVSSFNGSKPKSQEEIEELKKKLAEIGCLVKELEKKVVPALLKNKPLPCLSPNSISWGRYMCGKGAEKLEEAQDEKLRRDEILAKLGKLESPKKLKKEKKKK